MAFSFDNLINKIKQQFKPTTYLNVDTGEVIKKRIYKTLDETEKSSYIPTDKFEETTGRLPQTKAEVFEPNKPRISVPSSTEYGGTTKGFTIPKSSTYYDRQERERERQERKNKRWKERKEKERSKQEEREAKKRQKVIDKADRERKKKYEKAVEKWEKKQKTYKDVKPPAPPKDITKELETKLKEEPVTIYSIDKLKQELNALERKNFPMLDLSGTRSFLLGIVEEMENYYEGTDTYVNYLMENEEEIAELIQVIEYDSQQEEVEIAITNLATLLNMGILSDFQQDDLDYVQNTYGWSNE